MAGRGTDIKLGKDLDLTLEEAGLQIIGTERHESRRIDRQLRGPLRPPGRSGPVDLLPVAGRRPDAAVRVRPDRAVDGQERRRRGRGHHRRTGHPGHRAGAEAGRAAELPAAEAAARVRRRDEPAARGDLLAAAVRAGAGRGAQGRSAPDDRGGARAGGHPVPGRCRAARRSTTAAACARRSPSSTWSRRTSSPTPRRRPPSSGWSSVAKAEGEAGVPAEGRLPGRLRADDRDPRREMPRCCRR